MLIGYVSDEMYGALADVTIEFRNGEDSFETRSRASGAVHADIPLGKYEVILVRQGYGPKRVTIEVNPEKPYHFRLLSDRLYGYAWPKWVRSGESSEFRIHSAESYSLSVYRYGWKREFVKMLGQFEDHPLGSSRQLLPDGDFSRTGVNWNRQGFFVPNRDGRSRMAAPERSGLYYVHAVSASGKFCSFPWVVAPAAPSAEIAVLASSNTWNAYNDFGGRSNYIAPSALPAEPSVVPRQEGVWYRETGADYWSQSEYAPLSFDRPEPLNAVEREEDITDPLVRLGGEHVAPAEWRLLGWMEREGFDYDFYSDSQLHTGELPLDRYKVLVISTHPEYWSVEMYRRVKAWVFDEGGRLMYLGGNGINCMVEYPDADTIVPRNTDCSAARAKWAYRGEGALFPSRFGKTVEEESHLLGIRTTLSGMNTGAPYRVIDAGHWVFAGMDLKEGDLIGHRSLDCRCPGGASGHETDKMSEHSPAGTRLLAKGTNPDEGGGEMTYFETASQGAVFSVGSISYTCSIAVDPQISTVTANVLRRFLD